MERRLAKMKRKANVLRQQMGAGGVVSGRVVCATMTPRYRNQTRLHPRFSLFLPISTSILLCISCAFAFSFHNAEHKQDI